MLSSNCKGAAGLFCWLCFPRIHYACLIVLLNRTESWMEQGPEHNLSEDPVFQSQNRNARISSFQIYIK